MKCQIALYVVFLAMSTTLPGQVSYDQQVWTSVQAEKKLFSKTKAVLTLESRFNMDPLMAVRYFPNLAIQRKWMDHFTTSLHYRYITSNRGLGYREASHRMMFDAILNGSVKKTDLAFRLRIGREDEPGIREGILAFSEFVLRQKFSLKRKLFKQEFSFSFEQFETFRGNDVEFDQRRYTIGAEVKINKQNSLDFFLMYQDLISIRRVNLGLGYVFRFKD